MFRHHTYSDTQDEWEALETESRFYQAFRDDYTWSDEGGRRKRWSCGNYKDAKTWKRCKTAKNQWARHHG
jgi:hypothetical protein